MLTLLDIREKQIQITMRYNHTPIPMGKKINKKTLTTLSGVILHTAGGNAKWYCHFGKPFDCFL